MERSEAEKCQSDLCWPRNCERPATQYIVTNHGAGNVCSECAALLASDTTGAHSLDAPDPRDALLKEAREVVIVARGALRLDAMVDERGKPFGTTTDALEAISAFLARLDGDA